MRVTNIYLKYDGPFACDTADIAKALAVVDASQHNGLIWYSQEWEVAGIQREVLELAGDEHNEWYTRLQNECVRLGDVAAAQRAMRGIGQIIWGRHLGFAEEPSPGFCADLWDVEWERIPVEPPLVCAIQMMDSTDIGIVTCDSAVVDALEQNDLVKKRDTYGVDCGGCYATLLSPRESHDRHPRPTCPRHPRRQRLHPPPPLRPLSPKQIAHG